MSLRGLSGSRSVSFACLFMLLATLLPMTTSAPATAQSSPGCEPDPMATPAQPVDESVEIPEIEVPDDAIEVTVGYTPVSIFAPMFVAKEKGYFAGQGLDVSLEALPGGADMVVQAATGNFDAGLGGIGPAYWNAAAQELSITIIAPGHGEGSPVASPLMISTESCESGDITSIADLKGKKVAVNSPGATELWLARALAQGGLTIADIDLQYLPFPDAVAALDSGAIAASIVGEPLATKAENDGIAVRLASDFDVQGLQPTMIFASDAFLAEHPEAATGLVTAYLQAARDLTANFNDPVNLAIIEQYTGVPMDLVAASTKPVYQVDGHIDLDSLAILQTFFRERGLLEYDDDLDPETLVDTTFVDDALTRLGDE